MKKLKILAVFVFTVVLCAFSIGNVEANENDEELGCYIQSQINPEYDYRNCNDCGNYVSGEMGTGTNLTCIIE